MADNLDAEEIRAEARQEAEHFGHMVMIAMFAVVVISIGMWCAYGR